MPKGARPASQPGNCTPCPRRARIITSVSVSGLAPAGSGASAPGALRLASRASSGVHEAGATGFFRAPDERYWWPTVTIKLGGFSRMKQERVSEALERLGETADDVAFIVFISPQKRQVVYVCVYYTRANTTVAKVWRYLAAQEEAKIRKKIQHALSASS